MAQGCGTCGGFWKWFRPPQPNFFYEDCVVHDVFYDIGGDYVDRMVADYTLLIHMWSRVSKHFYKRKPLSRLWGYVLCVAYFLGVRLIGFTRFNYMEKRVKQGNFLGDIYRKYFGDLDFVEGSVGISGMFLAVTRILLFVVIHELLFSYGLKLATPFGVIAWITSVVSSFILSPLFIAGIAYTISKVFKIYLPTSFFGNSIKRFLSGAYIPIPYTIIWTFGK